jgi:hypothetical protein
LPNLDWLKIKKGLILLAHPTRFERVTFAFGGQCFLKKPAKQNLQLEKKLKKRQTWVSEYSINY